MALFMEKTQTWDATFATLSFPAAFLVIEWQTQAVH